jgi:hypothetical protein
MASAEFERSAGASRMMFPCGSVDAARLLVGQHAMQRPTSLDSSGEAAELVDEARRSFASTGWRWRRPASARLSLTRATVSRAWPKWRASVSMRSLRLRVCSDDCWAAISAMADRRPFSSANSTCAARGARAADEGSRPRWR